MARAATEPSVRRYLDEAVCCFAVGSYRAAYVLGWCAIADHLRLILGVVGAEVADVVYTGKDKKKGVEGWDGVSLIKAVAELRVFESPPWPDDLEGTLAEFYGRRGKCAHPSREPVEPEDVLALARAGRSVFSARVADARIGTLRPVQTALTRPGVTQAVRNRAVHALSARALVELAGGVLQGLFQEADEDDPGKAKKWELWATAVASPELNAEGKSKLMARLDEFLKPLRDDQGIVDPEIDDRLGVRATRVGDDLVIWDAVQPGHTRVWTYFVEAVNEDRPRQITHEIKDKYLARAPEEFRKRMIDAWARLEGLYGC